jgi:hypothetical protein
MDSFAQASVGERAKTSHPNSIRSSTARSKIQRSKQDLKVGIEGPLKQQRGNFPHTGYGTRLNAALRGSEAEGWPMTAKTSIADHDAEPRTQKPENHKGKKGTGFSKVDGTRSRPLELSSLTLRSRDPSFASLPSHADLLAQ